MSPDNQQTKLLLICVRLNVHSKRIYLSGEKVKQKKFFDDDYSSIMKVYWTMLAHIRESQWKQVLAASDHVDSSDREDRSDESGVLEVISARRGQFYIPSSPVKGTSN